MFLKNAKAKQNIQEGTQNKLRREDGKMKIIHKDLKKGTVKVKIEDSDDLWYLSSLIDPGDFVKSKTVRKMTAL